MTRRAACAAAALAVLLAGAPARARAPDLGPANLVLLEVRLGPDALTDSLTAYQSGRRTFLPLGELARLLTIAVRVQPAQQLASGFVLTENRPFLLDLKAGTVRIGERIEAVDPERVLLLDDEIYADADLIARWFPLDLAVDLSSLALGVQAREPLPLQQRLKREAAAAQATSTGGYTDPHFPRVAPRYELASVPLLDQTFGLNASRSQGSRQHDLNSTTFLTADLAGMHAQLFAAADSGGNATPARLTLGRDDPDGELLGPLHARSFAFGSVAVPGLSQVARSSPTGNGVLLGNLRFDRATGFDRHTFQGDLPPGWDVELFFNDALVGFQQSRPDGKYVFADRPLVYGANNFRLVFHGPQGQLRVERQTFLLDDSAIVPGELQYQLAAHRDQDGYTHAVAQADFGLTRWLALQTALVRAESQFTADTYQKTGVLLYGGPAIVTASVVRQLGHGALADLGLKTRFGGLLVSADHTRLNDFTSDQFAAGSDPVRQRDNLRLDGVLPFDALRRVPLTFELARDRLASGMRSEQAAAQAVGYLRGIILTNQLAWTSFGSQHTLNGSLQLASLIGDLGLRGQLGYTLRPERRLSTIGVAADRPLGDEWRAGLDVARQLDHPETRVTASLTKTLGRFGFALNAARGSGSLALGAQLFISAGREPRSGRWTMSAQPMANMGAASARVFVDTNMNGVRDPGEPLVANAGLNLNGMPQPARSGSDGVVLLAQLPPNVPADVSVSLGTLEDPQWTPAPRGLRFTPRAGHVDTLDLPLILTAEIDGTVTSTAHKGAADVLIELVDGDGKVVTTATTAADGFYILQFVPPGRYTVRVAPSQLRERGLSATAARPVTVAPDGAFVNGQDFQLRP